MALLIDCYNVLHVHMPPSLAGLDEAGLCKLLGTHPWAMQFGRIVVIADGMPKPRRASASPVPNVSLRFSGRGRSADDVIIHLIDGDSAPRSLTVVSSDHEIQRAARARRATVMEAATLIRSLARPSERRGAGSSGHRPEISEPLPGSLVDDWLTRFGADAGALGAPVSPAEVMAKLRAEKARRETEPAKPAKKKPAYRRYRTDRAAEPAREAGLPESEAAKWMHEFGIDERAVQAEVDASKLPEIKPTREAAASPTSKSKPGTEARHKPAPPVKNESSLDRLSDSDIDAWLKTFGFSPESDGDGAGRK